MEKITETEKYYLGGLFDGEGSISFSLTKNPTYKIGYQPRVIVRIAQKSNHSDPVKDLCERAGFNTIYLSNGMTSFTAKNRSNVGYILSLLKDSCLIKKDLVELAIRANVLVETKDKNLTVMKKFNDIREYKRSNYESTGNKTFVSIVF